MTKCPNCKRELKQVKGKVKLAINLDSHPSQSEVKGNDNVSKKKPVNLPSTSGTNSQQTKPRLEYLDMAKVEAKAIHGGKTAENLEKDGQRFGTALSVTQSSKEQKSVMDSEWSSPNSNSKAKKLMEGCGKYLSYEDNNCRKHRASCGEKAKYYYSNQEREDTFVSFCPSCQRAIKQYKEDLEEELENRKEEGRRGFCNFYGAERISHIQNELKILEGK